jgi:hypothetical protein
MVSFLALPGRYQVMTPRCWPGDLLESHRHKPSYRRGLRAMGVAASAQIHPANPVDASYLNEY